MGRREPSTQHSVQHSALPAHEQGRPRPQDEDTAEGPQETLSDSAVGL